MKKERKKESKKRERNEERKRERKKERKKERLDENGKQGEQTMKSGRSVDNLEERCGDELCYYRGNFQMWH